MRVRCVSLALTIFLAAFGGISVQAAGRGRALGSVVQSNNSMIDNETAMAGADVYACDVLDTDSYGNMRAQFGGSQILLAPSSEVVLDGDPNAVRVIVISGATSFSASSPAALEIDTPAGVLRESAGQAYSGTVSIIGPKELIISAARGDLVLNNGGELHTVPAGKSARVIFDRAADASCRKPGYVPKSYPPHKLAFELITVAATGGASYVIWNELQESQTKPSAP
jgi:hypothetical protein